MTMFFAQPGEPAAPRSRTVAVNVPCVDREVQLATALSAITLRIKVEPEGRARAVRWFARRARDDEGIEPDLRSLVDEPLEPSAQTWRTITVEVPEGDSEAQLAGALVEVARQFAESVSPAATARAATWLAERFAGGFAGGLDAGVDTGSRPVEVAAESKRPRFSIDIAADCGAIDAAIAAVHVILNREESSKATGAEPAGGKAEAAEPAGAKKPQPTIQGFAPTIQVGDLKPYRWK